MVTKSFLKKQYILHFTCFSSFPLIIISQAILHVTPTGVERYHDFMPPEAEVLSFLYLHERTLI